MQIFQRKPVLVHAFRVPLAGESASEDIPSWLLERMQSGEIYINSFGGLTQRTPWGARGCMPGDYLVLSESDQIGFVDQGVWEEEYEVAA